MITVYSSDLKMQQQVAVSCGVVISVAAPCAEASARDVVVPSSCGPLLHVLHYFSPFLLYSLSNNGHYDHKTFKQILQQSQQIENYISNCCVKSLCRKM